MVMKSCNRILAAILLFLLQWLGCVQGQEHQFGRHESLSMLVKENVEAGGKLIPIQKGEPLLRQPGTGFDLDCHLEPGKDQNVTVSWYVNGRRFRNKSRAKVIGWLPGGQFQDHQIRFLNFSHHDGGVYTCYTSVGNVSATLAVKPVISEVTKRQEVKRGEPFLLQCRAGGFPRPNIYWKHVPSGTLIQSKTVNVTHATLKDAGEYECTADNTYGNMTARAVVIVEQLKIRFRIAEEPETQQIIAGDTAYFSCMATGHDGEVPVVWFFSSQANNPHLGKSKLPAKGSTLAIGNFGTSNVGRYTCVVGSAGEQLTRTFDVELKANASVEDRQIKGPTGNASLGQCPTCSSATTITTSNALTLAMMAVLSRLTA